MDRALKEAQHYSHFDALKVPLKVYNLTSQTLKLAPTYRSVCTLLVQKVMNTLSYCTIKMLAAEYSDWNSIFSTGTLDTVYKLYYFGSGVLQKVMNTLSYYTIKKLANRHVSGNTAKSATYITFLGHSNSMSRQASHIKVYLAWFHSGIMLSQRTFQRCTYNSAHAHWYLGLIFLLSR